MPADAQAEGRRSWPGRWPGGAALAVLCLIVCVPGLRDLPPVDRDESRFAQASRQMLGSGTLGGWVVPMVGDRPRLGKPPVIYWLQSASAWAAGGRERAAECNSAGLMTGGVWVYRVPSLVAAVIAALLTWRIGLALWPRESRTAWLAGALLGCSLIVSWEARQARADMVLLAVNTAAMWMLWECWARQGGIEANTRRGGAPVRLAWRAGWVIGLWLLTGVGVMTKGPITPMVVVLTALTLAWATRRWEWLRTLRPAMGLTIVAVCVLPWVVLVAREVGWREFVSVVSVEVLGRSVSPAEGHWGPPGYHLVLLPVLLWPGSMLTAAGLVLAWKRLREDRSAGSSRWLPRFVGNRKEELFLLAWVAPSWIVFELVSTKLPHYTLPMYPALALLSARAVRLAASSAGAAGAIGLRTRPAWLGLWAWVVIGIVVASVLPTVLARVGGLAASKGWMTAFGALVGVGGGLVVASAMMLRRGAFGRAQALGIAAAATASAATVGIALPRLSALWLSSRLASAVSRADPAGARPIAAAGYHEDSLVFLTGGRIERIALAGVGEWLAAHEDGLAVIPTARVEEAEARSARRLRPLAHARGFNYSKWRWEDVVVAEAEGR